MRILCTICTDVFDGSRDISVVPCGHIFHSACLLQWIAQSMSCPQCRRRVNSKEIVHKLFLSISDAPPSGVHDAENVVRLESELEGARLALGQKDHEKNVLIAEKSALHEKLAQVTESYKVTEGILQHEINNSRTLKKELADYQRVKQEITKANDEVACLRKELASLQNVQAVINGCDGEIQVMISKTSDISDLATWCCMYKRELDKKRTDYRIVRDEMKLVRRDLEYSRAAQRDRESELAAAREKIRTLEEDIAGQDRRITSLEKNIAILEAAAVSPSGMVGGLAHRLLHESPAPFITPAKRPKLSRHDPNESCEDLFASPSVQLDFEPKNNTNFKRCKSSSSENLQSKRLDERSSKLPELKLVSAASDLTRRREVNDISNKHRVEVLSTLNIFKKRPASGLIGNSSVFRQGYNGFGGHETHISPRKRPSSQPFNIFKKPGVSKCPQSSTTLMPPPLPSFKDLSS